MTCEWCSERSEGCYNKDEEKCDFKSLPMDVEAIKARIDSEIDLIVAIMKTSYDDSADLAVAKADMHDRLGGIRIMKDVLDKKFNVAYDAKNQLEFTRLFMAFMVKEKKMARKAK